MFSQNCAFSIAGRLGGARQNAPSAAAATTFRRLFNSRPLQMICSQPIALARYSKTTVSGSRPHGRSPQPDRLTGSAVGHPPNSPTCRGRPPIFAGVPQAACRTSVTTPHKSGFPPFLRVGLCFALARACGMPHPEPLTAPFCSAIGPKPKRFGTESCAAFLVFERCSSCRTTFILKRTKWKRSPSDASCTAMRNGETHAVGIEGSCGSNATNPNASSTNNTANAPRGTSTSILAEKASSTILWRGHFRLTMTILG